MHGVLRLIQNELSKIFHQMSWKILTLLLLLLSVGAPILSYLTTGQFDRYDYYAKAEDNIEDYEEGSIPREYYQTIAEGYNYFVDQGFTDNTWQYENYISEYINNIESLRGCQLYLEGKDIMDITNWFGIDGVRVYWEEHNGVESWRPVYVGGMDEEMNPVETAPDGIIEIGGYYEETEVPFTAEIAKKIIDKCEKNVEAIKEKLKQTFEEYAKGQIKDYEPYYQQVKTEYEAAKTAYEQDKSKIQEYIAAKLAKEGCDILFSALNGMDFKNISKDMQNIFSNTLLRAARTIQDSSEYAQISEKIFDNEGYVYYMGGYYEDYGDFLAAVEIKQEQYYRAVKKYAYSLEHDIPIDGYSGRSRRMTEECLQINLSIIMFMGIFMAAVIVASEHTSGAVRLLMIRPRARWKILLSKLCCLLIYMMGWIIATSVLSTAVNAIIYGGKDLLIPYIMAGDEAFEVAPLIYYLWEMTIYFLPALSMVFLAFLLSVLVKRAVVSMAIPMIINIFGGPASHIFVGKPCKVCPPLKFTPIPYFDLSSFWGEPITQLKSYGSPLVHGLTLSMGVLMFVIYSLILLAAAFVIFKKQQIKN